MKRQLLTYRLLFFLLVEVAFSQTYAQQANTYVYSSAASAFTYIPGDGTSLISGVSGWDDNVFPNIPIGFTFYFEGNAYNTVGVSSNGFIWFGSGTVSTTEYNPISDATLGTGTITGVVSAFGTNLSAFPSTLTDNETGTPEISYATSGSACSQVFTVQWKGASAANDPGFEGYGSGSFSGSTGDDNRIDLQIKLDQTTNEISIYIRTYAYPYPQDGSNSGEVGIRGASNSDFTSLEVTNTCGIFDLHPYWTVMAQTSSNTEVCTNQPCYASPTSSYNFNTPSCSFTAPTNFTNASCGNNGTISIDVANGSGAYTYVINDGTLDSNSTGQFSGLGAGTYTTAVYNGTCAISGCTTITSNVTTPTAQNNGPLCGGNTLDLTTGTVPGAIYHWTGPNGFVSSEQNPVINNVTASDAGTYTLVDSISGCASAPVTTTVVISGTAPAAPTAGSNSPVCSGSTLDLTASTVAGASYNWSGPNGYSSNQQNPTIANATSANSGTYSVYTYIGSCQSLPVTVVVSVGAAPSLTGATSNSPICSGATLQLSAPSLTNATYSWTGPNSFSDTAQNPSLANITASDSGAYIVIAQLGTCTSTPDTVHVSIGQPSAPAITASPTEICANDSSHLCVSSTYPHYTWNTVIQGYPQDTTQCIYTNQAGNYYVTATDANGCSAQSNSVAIAVYPVPSVAIIKNGDTLSSYGENAYQWFRNDTLIPNATSYMYVATQPGEYEVQITDSNGCTALSSSVATAVQDLTNNTGFEIYPNPASTNSIQLRITAECVGCDIQIIDAIGRIVYESEVTGSTQFIDISKLAKGTYLIKIADGVKQFVRD